jgi:integrase
LDADHPSRGVLFPRRSTRERSAPTAKLRLAALRHLFDWLVTGQVIPTNPAPSVRGQRHSAAKGKTPVLDAAEARQLIDNIDISTPAGLRDRALIALMVYSFVRIGAALGMRVEDVYVQNRRLWVRLREKGGKRHEMPCHHTLEEYLHGYIDGVGIGDDPKGPLFRTIGRGTGRLTRTPLPQANAYAMVRRRAEAAGIGTRIGNQTFRATGITAYLRAERRLLDTQREGSRVLMPRAYIEMILSSKPGKRRWYLAMSCGSNVESRSRGTCSSSLPVPVRTVLPP